MSNFNGYLLENPPRYMGGGGGMKGGTGFADPRNFIAKSVDAAIERSAVRLQLCFESVIRTIFLPKSESITFIGTADPLKLLLKSAIRMKFWAKSADPPTLSPSPHSLHNKLDINAIKYCNKGSI